MNFTGAVSYFEATVQTLEEDIRTEEEWKKIWKRAVSLANINGSTKGQEEATDCPRDSKTWLQQLKVLATVYMFTLVAWYTNMYNTKN